MIGWHCPVRAITGLPCPGCGMSRALLSLLYGDIAQSLYYHPMLVPTGIAALIALFVPEKRKTTAIIWCILMTVCYGWRMITIFPQPPMDYTPGLVETLITKGIL